MEHSVYTITTRIRFDHIPVEPHAKTTRNATTRTAPHLHVGVILPGNAVPCVADAEKEAIGRVEAAVLQPQHVPGRQTNQPEHHVARG